MASHTVPVEFVEFVIAFLVQRGQLLFIRNGLDDRCSSLIYLGYIVSQTQLRRLSCFNVMTNINKTRSKISIGVKCFVENGVLTKKPRRPCHLATIAIHRHDLRVNRNKYDTLVTNDRH